MSTSRLFKKLAFVFSSSINHDTLREALLSFAEAFFPSNSLLERSGYHARRAGGLLIAKIQSASFTEADLLAAGILSVQYAFCINEGKFSLHLQVLMIALQNLVKSSKNQTLFVRCLWPVIRDVIIEGSRFLSQNLSDLVVGLCQVSREAMGEQTLTLQTSYKMEFFGLKSKEEAFYCCFWQQSRLLRRCFRFLMTKQSEGDLRYFMHAHSTLSEVKYYLESKEVEEIIAQIAARRLITRTEPEHSLRYGCTTFTLLVYRFNQLLIQLLEGPTIIHAASSVGAISAATSVVDLIQGEPVPSLILYPAFIDWSATGLLLRMLCIAGIQFSKIDYPQGSFPLFRLDEA